MCCIVRERLMEFGREAGNVLCNKRGAYGIWYRGRPCTV
jgi:hypothetical protein